MDNEVPRRPYKNQEQKDKELMLAYQKGILDERKVWEEVKKENDILKFREKKIKSYCFCKGDKLWRSVCAECQDWFKKELHRREIILKNKSKKEIVEGSWGGLIDSILKVGFNKHSQNTGKVRK